VEPPGSPLSLRLALTFRAIVASQPCDAGGDACHCCAYDGGDRARMLGWPPAAERSSQYWVEPIAWQKPVAWAEKAPA